MLIFLGFCSQRSCFEFVVPQLISCEEDLMAVSYMYSPD